MKTMSEQALEDDDGEEVRLPGLPPNTKNYMTPACYRRLLDEREKLVNVERPSVVNVVSWAASNGDRSENGDYQYGKRRLREIDRRIRFLNKRIESAEVVDPEKRPPTDQIFFGATVTYENLTTGTEHTIRIVGIDEDIAARIQEQVNSVSSLIEDDPAISQDDLENQQFEQSLEQGLKGSETYTGGAAEKSPAEVMAEAGIE